MELHQLDYVLAVAAYQNFTKAAEEVCVSQSSLSLQINKLEDELGVRLFERTTRSVYLTAAGKEFVVYAKRITDDMKQARKVMQEYVSMDKGHLSIGAFPVLQQFGLISQIAAFQKEYPHVKLEIVEKECVDLMEMMHRSEIDMAYLTDFKEHENINFYPLIYDELVLITNKNHPLAKKKIIDLKEAANEKFIFFSPATVYPDSLAACHEAGFEPQIAFLNPHETRVDTIMGLVKEGLGVTMFSSKVAILYQHLDIAIIHFNPKKPRIISLAIPHKNEKRPVVKNYLNFILKWSENNL